MFIGPMKRAFSMGVGARVLSRHPRFGGEIGGIGEYGGVWWLCSQWAAGSRGRGPGQESGANKLKAFCCRSS